MSNEITAIEFYEENGEIPSLFLVIETDKDTEFIFNSDFYIGLIANKYFLTDYIHDYVYHGEPMSAGPLTEKGVRLYFPEAEHFCQVDYIKVDMDFLMSLEQ